MYMKRVKSVICLALTSALALSVVLTGCGSKKVDESKETVTTSSVSQSETTKVLDPVTIKWYLPGDPQSDQEQVWSEANKIIKEKINATLDMTFIKFADYSTKMNMIIASGEPWDLCFTSNWTNDYLTNVKRGAFLAIDDLLPVYFKDVLNSDLFVEKKTMDAIKIEDKTYGLKYDSPIPFHSGFEGQKAIFDKVNFDIKTVKKLSDLEPFLAKVKAEMPDITPFAPNAYDNVLNLAMIMNDTNDGKYEVLTPTLILDTTTKKIKLIYDIPEYLESAKVLRDYYNKGYIKKDAASIKLEPSDLKNYGVWFSNVVQLLDSGVTNGTLSFGFPCVEVKNVNAVIKNSDCIGVMSAVNSKSENPERALMCANLVGSDMKVFNILANGIKDKQYTEIGQAPDRPIIKPIENKGYAPANSWTFGPYALNYATEQYTYDLIKIEKQRRIGIKASEFIKYSYLPSAEVKNEAVVVDATWGKYKTILNTGSLDPVATIEKCKNELIKAGIDKVVADAQKQFDAVYNK